jgi:hypothetical protein
MFTSQAESMKEIIAQGRILGKPKTVARNTFKYIRNDGAIVYRLHHTDILVVYLDGTFQISSGGWKTITTKDRINQFMPAGWSVFSDRGIWYVRRRDGQDKVPFYEDMHLPEALDKQNRGVNQSLVNGQLALKKRIDAFVKKTIVKGKPIPLPSQGDCFYCLMFNAEKPVPVGSYGYATQNPEPQDNSHLLSHIDEGYMHGSLIVNAMRFAGYRDAGIALWLNMPGDRGYATIRRAVRRYLGRKLGLASH